MAGVIDHDFPTDSTFIFLENPIIDFSEVTVYN